jgi:hypothetical protein
MVNLDLIKKNDRYKNCILLEKPVMFCSLFNDKDYDLVQVHDMNVYDEDKIIGFSGVFKWENNQIIPLDYDSYTPEMTVIGYEEFPTKNGRKGLDILVESW